MECITKMTAGVTMVTTGSAESMAENNMSVVRIAELASRSTLICSVKWAVEAYRSPSGMNRPLTHPAVGFVCVSLLDVKSST